MKSTAEVISGQIYLHVLTREKLVAVHPCAWAHEYWICRRKDYEEIKLCYTELVAV